MRRQDSNKVKCKSYGISSWLSLGHWWFGFWLPIGSMIYRLLLPFVVCRLLFCLIVPMMIYYDVCVWTHVTLTVTICNMLPLLVCSVKCAWWSGTKTKGKTQRNWWSSAVIHPWSSSESCLKTRIDVCSWLPRICNPNRGKTQAVFSSF